MIVGFAEVTVLIYNWQLKAGSTYTISSDSTVYSRQLDDLLVLGFVALLCLTMLAIALTTDRRRRGSRTACLALLVFSIIAVGAGIVTLTHTNKATCEECGFLNCGSYYVGGPSDAHPVECPPSFVERAKSEAQVADQRAIALIIMGSMCAISACVLFLRARRAAHDSVVESPSPKYIDG